MKLTKVTFTGVDERTDLKRLARLQRAFPFAEFGFLISKDWRQNGNRFPNPNIMWNLANQWSQQPFSLSLHMCGELAMEAAKGDWSYDTFSEAMNAPELITIFERVQLNVSSKPLFDELHRFRKGRSELIVQMRSASICKQFLESGSPEGMSYLIDSSGGRGIDTPIEVVDAPGIHIGYAGGIGPENVESKLRTLLEYDSKEKFWIDMETRVRTKDEWLDLDKVEQVLEICNTVMKEYQ